MPANAGLGGLATAEESWADTIEKRYQRRRRGPLDQDAALTIPPARQNFSKRTMPAALGQRLKGQNAMLISEDYAQLAERCLRLASECPEPLVADALRALAVDYLARAGSPAGLGRALSWE